MKRILLSIILIPAVIFILINIKNMRNSEKAQAKAEESSTIIFAGIVQPRDTMEAIFDRHSFDRTELAEILRSSKKIYNLAKLSIGNVYSFETDKEENRIQNLQYEIDNLSYLSIQRGEDSFSAKKVDVNYTKKIGALYLSIKDNLISSLPGSGREYLQLALKLSDIYAWDIDFTSDIRNGDYVKIAVEELWVGNVFNGYGDILSAEFLNNGKIYKGYRFEHDGYTDYYDEDGKSLRRAFLKAPLNFRRISSSFSGRRFHPVLKIYRPHHGLDYAAPAGTPVSAVGDGTVVFSGYKGQYGNLVIIKHPNGYKTYYGHLSRIGKNIKNGVKTEQGQIIGHVGSTGLATGPHLHYEVRADNKPVNPLSLKLQKGKSIPQSLMTEFRHFKNEMDSQLASIKHPVFASADQKIDNTL